MSSCLCMNKGNGTKGKRLDFLRVIMLIGSVPLLSAIIILTICAATKMENELETSTYARLRACAISVQKYFEWDIREEILEKDDVSYEFIDSLQKDEIELTFFEGDTRFITSIKDKSGNRVEGTKASEEVWNIVKTGKDYQSDGIDISGAKYYVYYTPVCTDDGKVIGMAFAGEKEAIVNDAKNNLMISFVKIALVLTVVYLIILIWLARIIRKPIAKTAADIENIANGNISNEISGSSQIAETDKLITASRILKEKLNDIVSGVNEHVLNLQQDTASLKERADFCNDGTKQISQAMEELSVTAVTLAENVQDVNAKSLEMGNAITDIDGDVQVLSDNSNHIFSVIKYDSLSRCDRPDRFVKDDADPVFSVLFYRAGCSLVRITYLGDAAARRGQIFHTHIIDLIAKQRTGKHIRAFSYDHFIGIRSDLCDKDRMSHGKSQTLSLSYRIMCDSFMLA